MYRIRSVQGTRLLDSLGARRSAEMLRSEKFPETNCVPEFELLVLLETSPDELLTLVRHTRDYAFAADALMQIWTLESCRCYHQSFFETTKEVSGLVFDSIVRRDGMLRLELFVRRQERRVQRIERKALRDIPKKYTPDYMDELVHLIGESKDAALIHRVLVTGMNFLTFKQGLYLRDVFNLGTESHTPTALAA